MLVTAAFMAALWFVVRQEIPAASREIAYILLGTLGAKFGDIVAYWVGSSSGSAAEVGSAGKGRRGGGRALGCRPTPTSRTWRSAVSARAPRSPT
jgi:hypothetical protein